MNIGPIKGYQISNSFTSSGNPVSHGEGDFFNDLTKIFNDKTKNLVQIGPGVFTPQNSEQARFVIPQQGSTVNLPGV
jgi:hypothetical protein